MRAFIDRHIGGFLPLGRARMERHVSGERSLILELTWLRAVLTIEVTW